MFFRCLSTVSKNVCFKMEGVPSGSVIVVSVLYCGLTGWDYVVWAYFCGE